MGPLDRRRLVLLELVTMWQRADVVLDDQRCQILPLGYEVHVAERSLQEPPRIRSRRTERTERCISGIRTLIEELPDEVGMDQLSLPVPQSPERVRLVAASSVLTDFPHGVLRLRDSPTDTGETSLAQQPVRATR